MGKPQSFKDIFKNKKQVPFSPQARQFSVAKTPLISPEERERQQKAKKELTKFVNTLRCMVCGSQLDGPVNHEYADLYCVMDHDHYTCKYNYGKTQPERSGAIYNFPDYAIGYQVISFRNGEEFYNEIYKLDLNLISKFRFRDRKCVLTSKGSIIKFPKGLNFQDFEQKLKVYTVFS